MKTTNNITVLLIALFLSFGMVGSVNAQSGFKLAKKVQIEKVSYQLTIEGKVFEVFRTEKGQNYVLRVSKKTGKEYKQYLGYEYGERFNGLSVYTDSKEERFWVLGLNASEFPSRIYLTKD